MSSELYRRSNSCMFYLRPALEYCIIVCHALNFMQYATLCAAQRIRRSARLCEIDSVRRCSAVDRQRMQVQLVQL